MAEAKHAVATAAAVAAAGIGGGDEFDNAMRVVDDARGQIADCWEEEQEHQRQVDQAKVRREFIQKQALDALRVMSDPKAFAAIMARRPYDAALKAKCPAVPAKMAKEGVADRPLFDWLRAHAEEQDEVLGEAWMTSAAGTLSFHLPGDTPNRPTLAGGLLLDAVRRVLGIPYPVKPGKAPPANKPSARPDRKPRPKRIRHRSKPVLRDAAADATPAPSKPEPDAKPAMPRTELPLLNTALGLSLEELREAVSIGEVSIGQKTGLCRRIITFSGHLYGVYGWEKAEVDGESFTLFEMVPVEQWPKERPAAETYEERRKRVGRVEIRKAGALGGLIVAGADGQRYVIDDAVRLEVLGKGGAP